MEPATGPAQPGTVTGPDDADPSETTATGAAIVATVAPVLERCSLVAERLTRLLVPLLPS
jgi:hypothetical protein